MTGPISQSFRSPPFADVFSQTGGGRPGPVAPAHIDALIATGPTSVEEFLRRVAAYQWRGSDPEQVRRYGPLVFETNARYAPRSASRMDDAVAV